MLDIESTSQPKNADHQPLISNPGSRAAQIFNTAAFTTKVNKPRVIIVIGKVRKNKMGQIKALANPIKRAAIMAVTNPLIRNPGTIFDVSKTHRADWNR